MQMCNGNASNPIRGTSNACNDIRKTFATCQFYAVSRNTLPFPYACHPTTHLELLQIIEAFKAFDTIPREVKVLVKEKYKYKYKYKLDDERKRTCHHVCVRAFTTFANACIPANEEVSARNQRSPSGFDIDPTPKCGGNDKIVAMFRTTRTDVFCAFRMTSDTGATNPETIEGRGNGLHTFRCTKGMAGSKL